MAKLSTELKISGQAIFEPSSQSIEIATVQTADSGRDNANEMFIYVVDGNQQSVSLEWHGLTFAEGAQLLSLLRKGVFTFTYRDPVSNTIVTRHFYAGNRHATIYNKYLGIYEVISVDVIDMRYASDGDRTEPSPDA